MPHADPEVRRLYQRDYDRGHPTPRITGRPRRGTDARFWSYVGVSTDNDCWTWEGHRLHNRYGQTMLRGRRMRAHRMAWELTFGLVPDGLQVLHTCDNPTCVNP